MLILPIKNKPIKSGYDDNRFHIVVAPALALAQPFGLLPITGIFSKNINDIKFKLLSFGTLHTCLWFFSAIAFLLLELSRAANEGNTNIKTFSGIIFYCVGISSSYLFIRITYKWNEFLHLFREVDNTFSSSPYTLSGWNLRKRIRLLVYIASTFAFCEHLFALYSSIHDRYVQAEICKWEIGSWFYYVTTYHLGHVYRLLPVNPYFVLWAEYIDFSFAFVWNYIDLFIMVMSLCISTKFKMLNRRLEFFKGRVVPDPFWDEIRQHYNKICDLNDYVDKFIGSLICIACLSDLYFVCLQILNFATPHPYTTNQIYYGFSAMFLISRTFMMCVTAASVNDESIKPLAIFRTIPSHGWCQSLHRLSEQIQQKSVALSGRKFFIMTRSIIVSMAGTIITYELVMIQFGGDKILSGMFNPCGDLGNITATLDTTLD